MSLNKKNNDDFYIGWQEKAPPKNVAATRRFVWVAALLSVLVAVALVLGQRGFADSVFELGKLTTVEGVLIKQPAPMLQTIEDGKVKSILLVGFGKAGPEKTIAEIEQQQGIDLEGKGIELSGTLIYYQDKKAMELTKGVKSFVALKPGIIIGDPFFKDFGTVSLKGEILDPKCALGVMKPGYGKPHRSCAVRCISGGITPVLRVTGDSGASNYCIVKGPGGEAINEAVLPYVADQLRLCGRLEQQNDWLVFYTNPGEDFVRLIPYWMNEDIPLCH